MVTGFRRTNTNYNKYKRRDSRYIPRRRVCQFCEGKTDTADYKDIPLLNRFINDRARMEPRKRTGTCARHQRMISRAIKRARAVGMLPIHSSHEKVFISQLSRERKLADTPSRTAENTSVSNEESVSSSDSPTVESPSVLTEEVAGTDKKEEPVVGVSASDAEEVGEGPSSVVAPEEANVEEKQSES